MASVEQIKIELDKAKAAEALARKDWEQSIVTTGTMSGQEDDYGDEDIGPSEAEMYQQAQTKVAELEKKLKLAQS